MALFKGSMIATASGKYNGMVFAHNSAGQYFRQYVVPTNPNTTKQQEVRLNFGQMSIDWRDLLTEAQRMDWGAIAGTITATNAFGDPITLNGQQAYIRAATLAMQAGMPNPTNAPEVTGETPLGMISAIGGTALTQIIGGTVGGAPNWAGDDDGRLLIYLGRGKSPATNFYKGPWQLVGTEAGVTATPITAFSVTNPVSNYQMVQALKYWIKLRAYLDGRLSQEWTGSFIAA